MDKLELAELAWRDLVKTYPQMRLDMVTKEAESLIAGNPPKGIIGVTLQGVWRRAGLD